MKICAYQCEDKGQEKKELSFQFPVFCSTIFLCL